VKINAGQLDGQLQRGLAGVYWVTGDETLLVQECCDRLRQYCRSQGFGEREIHHVEPRGFDWPALFERANSLSLFAERQIIELRIASARPGTEVFEAVADYAANANPDTVVLVTSPRLDSKVTRAKPWERLEQAIVVVQVWPITADRLPDWIHEQLRANNLGIEPEALEMLCTRVEGNLLAARQEIDKITLLAGGQTITLDDVQRSVADSARYTGFGLVDQALAGDTARRRAHGGRPARRGADAVGHTVAIGP